MGPGERENEYFTHTELFVPFEIKKKNFFFLFAILLALVIYENECVHRFLGWVQILYPPKSLRNICANRKYIYIQNDKFNRPH